MLSLQYFANKLTSVADATWYCIEAVNSHSEGLAHADLSTVCRYILHMVACCGARARHTSAIRIHMSRQYMLASTYDDFLRIGVIDLSSNSWFLFSMPIHKMHSFVCTPSNNYSLCKKKLLFLVCWMTSHHLQLNNLHVKLFYRDW